MVGLIIGLWVNLFWSLLALCFLGVTYALTRNFKGLLLLICAVGFSYYNLHGLVFYASSLEPLVGQTVVLKAEVKGESRLSRSGRQTVRLQLKALKNGHSSWRKGQGFLLWENAPLPVFKAGDSLEIKGTITNLTSFSSDFDLTQYWERWGVRHRLIRAQVLSRPQTKPALYARWRQIALTRIAHHLDKPHSTIALGMLIGLKEKLPRALEADFKKAGLQHLLVVSGTNVTLLMALVGLLLRPLGAWLKYGLGLGFLFLYLNLVGFEPPALRASLFGLLIGFALASGFNLDFRNLLLVCAVMLCLVDPRFLTHDISFWLSFSATLGIFLAVPVLNSALFFIKNKYVRLLLAASVAAQTYVFPILIIKFGSFPYGGLLSNLLTEPLVPLIMGLSFGAIVIGSFKFLLLEQLWSGALNLSITALIKLAQITATLPEVMVPPVAGFSLGVGLVAFSVWALFSPFYQTKFWQPFEATIKL
jgi:ComEC/Rec2-related protein